MPNKATEKLKGINFLSNLRYLIDKNKLTAVELGKQVGVSAELIGKLKNGNLRNPTLKVLLGMSDYFKLSIPDLVYSDLSKVDKSIQARKSANYVPIVAWSEIARFGKDQPESYLLVDKVMDKHTFALKLDQAIATIPENSYVLINTKLLPKTQDCVLVMNKDKQYSLCKIIIEDSSYLQSLTNKMNELTKYSQKQHKIIGVVLGYQKTQYFVDGI